MYHMPTCHARDIPSCLQGSPSLSSNGGANTTMGESGSKSVTDIPKPSEAIRQNAEKSLLTKGSGNFFQTETVIESELSVITSASNVKPNLHLNIVEKVKPKLTLQEYRKQVGIKVITQKPSQKIGIKAKSESTLEDKHESEIKAAAGCPHCGNLIKDSASKCPRCMRAFEKDKMVHLPVDHSMPESKSFEISMSKEPCYGNRRPRTQNAQPSRQFRAKFEEPQCVTLSSDEEDDSFQENKKLKSDGADNLCKLPVISPPHMPVQANIPEDTSGSSLNSPEGTKEIPSDLLRWKDGGLSGAFFAVNCRSVRIGSYKFTPNGRVLFSSEGIMLEAPVYDPHQMQPTSLSSSWINIAIPAEKLLKVQAHFNRKLPVIFLNVTPTCSRSVSKQIGLIKSSSDPYWDTLSQKETEKLLTLLPYSLDDPAKNAIKQAFVHKGVFQEIDAKEANRLLVISSPPEVRDALGRLPPSTIVSAETSTASSKDSTACKENSKIEMRITRGGTKNPPRVILPVVPMFSWSDGPDRFSVTTEDYACLNQDNLLNDSIIDFYLRYVFSTKLDDNLKRKCHVFSSFFYQRLTTRPPKVNGRKHPIEDNISIPIMDRRHSRVKSWTKKVNIFEKDYLVIPINERSHWFLAIVCFPGLSGPVSLKDNTPIKLDPYQKLARKLPPNQSKKLVTVDGESFHIGNTTVTPVSSKAKTTKNVPVILSIDTDRDEAETDEEDIILPADVDIPEKTWEIMEPIKQPCILFFDSLAGSSHNRVAATLREYLMVEYQAKNSKEDAVTSKLVVHDNTITLFSKETMVSACLDVPQQNNSYDCGVYVLQYAESFMKKPFLDFNIHKLNLFNWFPNHMAGRKRKNIQFLLIRLTKEKNQLAESVLDLLPKEDVRVALQDRRRSLLVAPTTVTLEKINEIQETDKTLSVTMTNEEKPNGHIGKNGIDGMDSADYVLDQEANIEID